MLCPFESRLKNLLDLGIKILNSLTETEQQPMRHFYRTSDRPIYHSLIITIIMLMVAALHNLRDARAQSSQLPIVPNLDDATLSRLRTIFTDGQAKGNRADVFAKVGDSITESQSFLSGF